MKNLLTTGALVLALATLAVTPATAAEYKAGEITIVNPWARATPGVPRNGSAYLTIKGGGGGDELTGVDSGVAMHAQLHGHKNENGVMKMHQVHGLRIPPGGTATLKPGGLHIMLMKLKRGLKEGESFPITLHFAKAGKVTVEVEVLGVGARDAGQGMGHDGHGKMKMKMTK